MKLTIASKVTIARICLIPVFIVCYHLWGDLWSGAIPAAVFILASMTDWVDGYLARSRNEVTNFGKFMDPIADKLLVMSAFVLLVGDGRMTGVSCIIILAREFIISGFRLIASDRGMVLAAGKLGKIKTCTQLLTLILFLLDGRAYSGSGFTVGNLMVWVVVAMTLWSGIDYFWKNRSALGLKEEAK